MRGCSGSPTTMIVRSPSGVMSTMSRVCGSMRRAAWMVAPCLRDLVVDVERGVVDADRGEEVDLGVGLRELEEGDAAAAAGDDDADRRDGAMSPGAGSAGTRAIVTCSTWPMTAIRMRGSVGRWSA